MDFKTGVLALRRTTLWGILVSVVVTAALTLVPSAGAAGTPPRIEYCFKYGSTLARWDTSYLRDNYGSGTVLAVQFVFVGASYTPKSVIDGDTARSSTPNGATEVYAVLLLENGAEPETRDTGLCV